MAVCYLVGFMGCGKTTIGRELSDYLQLPFIDSDEYIEVTNNRKIDEIFALEGEEIFREIEHKAIKELNKIDGVISVGGGAFIKENNREVMTKNAPVFYLNCDFPTIYERIKDTNRPLVASNTIEQLEVLYKSRLPIYEQDSKIVHTKGKTVEDIVMEIAALLNSSK